MFDLWPWAKRVALDPQQPRWKQRLATGYMRHYVARHVGLPLDEATDAGAGLAQTTWPANTTPDVILCWFDETLAYTPNLGSFDETLMSLILATPEEIASVFTTGIPLPADRMIVQWYGSKQAWWMEGREQIAAAIPANHDGLYTTSDSVAATFKAAFMMSRQPH